MEEVNQGDSDANSININNHHGVCAICLNGILLQETALVKGCEHAYCVTCILRWASCKEQPTCPQCKNPFDFLIIHRALDGSIHDYMFEESVVLLLRAPWFNPLVEVEKEEELFYELDTYYEEEQEEEELEEEEYQDEVYVGNSSSIRIGNRRWGDNGYVRAERREAGPTHRQHIVDSNAAPSLQHKKTKNPPAIGRRAKRALKREAAAKQHLPRSGPK